MAEGFVVGGSLERASVEGGDFDVEAEDVVVADLEGFDAGLFDIFGFEGGHDLAAVVAELAGFVEIGARA